MNQKMIFQNLEKVFQCAYYTSKGDFIKLAEKTFTDLDQANREFGFVDGTPSGEYVACEEGEVEAPVEANVVQEGAPSDAVVEVAQAQEQVDVLEEKVEDLTDAQTLPQTVPEGSLPVNEALAEVAPVQEGNTPDPAADITSSTVTI